MRSDIVTASSGTFFFKMYNVFYHAKKDFIMIVCQ